MLNLSIDQNMLIAVIEGIGVIIAITTLAIGVFQFNKQQRLSFFEKYTARYQHIMEIMPESVLSNRMFSQKDKEQATRAIRLYIDLCSEEFYLHDKKFLDKKVWKEWREGMEIMFSKPSVLKVYEKSYGRTYTDFATFVENELLNGVGQKSKKE